MKNLKVVSIFILVCFLFNIFTYDTVYSVPIADNDPQFKLATASLFNSLLGIQHKDISTIKLAFDTQLKFLDKVSNGKLTDTSTDFSDVVSKAEKYKNTRYNPPNMQFLLHEVEGLPEGLYCVQCNLTDKKHGKRKYFAVFSLRSKNGAFPVEVYKDEEWENAEKFIRAYNVVPVRQGRDAEVIENDMQHQKYDNVIEWAHQQKGLVYSAKQLKNLDYKDILAEIVKTAGLNDGLARQIYSSRKLYIVALTDEVKERLKANLVTVIDKNGNPREVVAYSHTSDNAIHIFLPQELIDVLTSSAGHVSGMDHGVFKAVKDYLAHEIGVMVRAPLRFETDGEEIKVVNEIDDRYRHGAAGEELEPKEYQLVDLDYLLWKDLITGEYVVRDYASQNKKHIAPNPGDVWRTILLSPELQKREGFTIEEYRAARQKARRKYPNLLRPVRKEQSIADLRYWASGWMTINFNDITDRYVLSAGAWEKLKKSNRYNFQTLGDDVRNTLAAGRHSGVEFELREAFRGFNDAAPLGIRRGNRWTSQPELDYDMYYFQVALAVISDAVLDAPEWKQFYSALKEPRIWDIVIDRGVPILRGGTEGMREALVATFERLGKEDITPDIRFNTVLAMLRGCDGYTLADKLEKLKKYADSKTPRYKIEGAIDKLDISAGEEDLIRLAFVEPDARRNAGDVWRTIFLSPELRNRDGFTIEEYRAARQKARKKYPNLFRPVSKDRSIEDLRCWASGGMTIDFNDTTDRYVLSDHAWEKLKGLSRYNFRTLGETVGKYLAKRENFDVEQGLKDAQRCFDEVEPRGIRRGNAWSSRPDLDIEMYYYGIALAIMSDAVLGSPEWGRFYSSLVKPRIWDIVIDRGVPVSRGGTEGIREALVATFERLGEENITPDIRFNTVLAMLRACDRDTLADKLEGLKKYADGKTLQDKVEDAIDKLDISAEEEDLIRMALIAPVVIEPYPGDVWRTILLSPELKKREGFTIEEYRAARQKARKEHPNLFWPVSIEQSIRDLKYWASGWMTIGFNDTTDRYVLSDDAWKKLKGLTRYNFRTLGETVGNHLAKGEHYDVEFGLRDAQRCFNEVKPRGIRRGNAWSSRPDLDLEMYYYGIALAIMSDAVLGAPEWGRFYRSLTEPRIWDIVIDRGVPVLRGGTEGIREALVATFERLGEENITPDIRFNTVLAMLIVCDRGILADKLEGLKKYADGKTLQYKIEGAIDDLDINSGEEDLIWMAFEESSIDQKLKRSPARHDDGRFKEEDGKNPDAALEVITESLAILNMLDINGYFDAVDYLRGWEETAHRLGFIDKEVPEKEDLPSRSTIWRDLKGLIAKGYLTKELVGGKNRYRLTGRGRAARAITKMRLAEAEEAGFPIPIHPDDRYFLFLPDAFYKGSEFSEHAGKFSDRFDLNMVSLRSGEEDEFINEIVKRASEKGVADRAVALVPRNLSAEQLRRLTDAGIRFIVADVEEIIREHGDDSGYRQKFQFNTYAMLLLTRYIGAEDIHKRSSAYKLLSFYLESHFDLGETPVDKYIEAIIGEDAEDIATLITGYLMYRPAERYNAEDEYEKMTVTFLKAA